MGQIWHFILSGDSIKYISWQLINVITQEALYKKRRTNKFGENCWSNQILAFSDFLQMTFRAGEINPSFCSSSVPSLGGFNHINLQHNGTFLRKMYRKQKISNSFLEIKLLIEKLTPEDGRTMDNSALEKLSLYSYCTSTIRFVQNVLRIEQPL